MFAYDSLQTNIADGIAEIRLNRPEQHNAFSRAMHHDVSAAFHAVAAMSDVRAVVFGANGKTFSAGGDFDLILENRANPALLRAMAEDGRDLLMAVGNCPIPVVCALHGDAVGLGATLLLAADAVVAARTARISDPHVVVGLVAGDGGVVVWPLSTSFMLSKRYLLTGDRIPAEDARTMGLVSDLVDRPEDALPAAHALARRMAALPPLAVRGTKRAANQLFRQRMDALFDFGMAAEVDSCRSDDIVEAIDAFRNRRPPQFKGS